MTRRYAMLIAVVLIAGCVTSGTQSEDNHGQLVVADSTELALLVADSTNLMPLPRANISVVSPEGIESLGLTDNGGRFTISKEELRRRDAMVLLACAEYYFCGAFRIREDNILGFDERWITLARLSMR